MLRSMWDRTACLTELHTELLLGCEVLTKDCVATDPPDFDADNSPFRLPLTICLLQHSQVIASCIALQQAMDLPCPWLSCKCKVDGGFR